MKVVIFCLAVLVGTISVSVAQQINPVWSVPSFVQYCSDTLKYRYIYPGPISFDSSGTLVWFYRNRSTCETETNNFTVLNVKPDGTPLLATLGQFETPSSSYYEAIASHGNRAYWAGSSSYVVDSNKSLVVRAYDATMHHQLWTASLRLDVSINSLQPIIAASGEAVYTAISYSQYGLNSENKYSTTYYMLLTKWDTAGHKVWTNTYGQGFSQAFKGNLLVTDSFVYACGIRYDDAVPYDHGMGFVGAYRVSDGELVKTFHYPKKRQLSDYTPTTVLFRDSFVVLCGVNATPADASTFISAFDTGLELRSFEETPSYAYSSSFVPAALDENNMLYLIRTDFDGYGYHVVLDIANCKNGNCHTIRRNVLLDPMLSSIGDIQASYGSVYLSMSIVGRDSSRSYFPVYDYDASLVKYDMVPLAVSMKMIGEAAMAVYPNPVTTIAKFMTREEIKNGEIEIADALGRTVRSYSHLSGSEFIFDRSGLSSGLYYYTLSEQGMLRASGKMIVR